MPCLFVQLICLKLLMFCLLSVTGRQLLRPAMGGSKSTRSKENYNKTVSKTELNGKIDRNLYH